MDIVRVTPLGESPELGRVTKSYKVLSQQLSLSRYLSQWNKNQKKIVILKWPVWCPHRLENL